MTIFNTNKQSSVRVPDLIPEYTPKPAPYIFLKLCGIERTIGEQFIRQGLGSEQLSRGTMSQTPAPQYFLQYFGK